MLRRISICGLAILGYFVLTEQAAWAKEVVTLTCGGKENRVYFNPGKENTIYSNPFREAEGDIEKYIFVIDYNRNLVNHKPAKISQQRIEFASSTGYDWTINRITGKAEMISGDRFTSSGRKVYSRFEGTCARGEKRHSH